MISEMVKILGNSRKTIYRWKEEQRPIINLLEKYFTQEDLQEFLETSKISKYDQLLEYENFKNINRIKYISYFLNQSATSWDKFSTDFYFGLLAYIRLTGNEFDSFSSAAISYSLRLDKPKKDLHYNTREVMHKRVLPILEYLDKQDGMFQYLINISQNELEDLKNYKIDKHNYILNKNIESIDKELEYHIKKFKQFNVGNRLE